MKVVVTGTRGIPNVKGGVETHCQSLYPRIVALGHEVIVFRRKNYAQESDYADSYEGVKICDVWAPKSKIFEAFAHTFLCILKAKSMKADLVHIHAIGPSIMAPLARLLGMKVVVTNHGPDYDRQKWGKFAKFVLSTGERLGTKWANKIIVISQTIADIVSSKYGRNDAALIFNGVNIPNKSQKTDYIESLGLKKRGYILAIGRFVEEKGFHDLIEAYKKSKIEDFKLVIAGDADFPDAYSQRLKRQAEDAGVVLTGYIGGEKLNQIMTNASLYVMPSYHEGLPIALLEALSYDLDVIVSDIPANKLKCLDENDFFRVGNVDHLTAKINEKLINKNYNRIYDLSAYNWDEIAKKTVDLYNQL